MKYENEVECIFIKKGDYVLTKDFELLQVAELLTDGVVLINGKEIACDEIVDVKKWEEKDENFKTRTRTIY